MGPGIPAIAFSSPPLPVCQAVPFEEKTGIEYALCASASALNTVVAAAPKNNAYLNIVASPDIHRCSEIGFVCRGHALAKERAVVLRADLFQKRALLAP